MATMMQAAGIAGDMGRGSPPAVAPVTVCVPGKGPKVPPGLLPLSH